ncbi:nicotinate-nicotinamide nucleotide adenylyltransferase [Psychrobacter sp. P2G3]|uniref:nicotinate-nicotinamide nucleotide adenylyltransferase n=1 Tax=Psychrobacter sp. P2G3 TaxID=1699622 RepID=UPI00078B2E1B|nr:nicotinate-nicotinamide nucleotide adenylyltransferase [Psychrobacter sp. P2G3]AMN48703.1 nicotinate-nucleotide adenylyltransferase [Psychrobacter sp. P2G3]
MPHSAQATDINSDLKNDISSADKEAAPAIRAYLGGSFDPVHEGHLQMAMHVYQDLLPIAEEQQRKLHVSLLPNARSPFKDESTNPEHRLTMLKLATQNTPLKISELELWQTPPVYTINSVQTLRERYPNDCLIFIMGMDSARSLDKWKDGLQLTDYVNLWIFNRFSIAETNSTDENENLIDKNSIAQHSTVLQPQLVAQLPSQLQDLITNSPTELITPTAQTLSNNAVLKNSNQGRIYIDPRPVVAVSSTQIRQQLPHQKLQNTENRLNIMPIAETQITSVQPINDIMSNTESNPLAKWLNPAVYQYIIAHQLYSAAQFR